MTAKDVLELIKKNLGSPWNESTYRDVFHAGDPNVEVKGIATTFMSTLDLLQRAHAAGMSADRAAQRNECRRGAGGRQSVGYWRQGREARFSEPDAGG